MSLKRFKANLLAYGIAVITLIVPVASPFSYTIIAFDGTGAGLPEDPYLITTCDQLQDINSEPSAYYRLENNIDTDDCSLTFTPIVTFSGDFNGNAKTINLDITSATPDTGLFKILSSASVYDLSLTGTIASSSTNVGSVAGYMESGSIVSRIKSDVSISAGSTNDIGGLIGEMNSSEIYASYFEGFLNASSRGGGLVGQMTNGSVINDSYSSGEIYTTLEAGGLVGWIDGAFSVNQVYNSFSTSLVHESNHADHGVFGAIQDNDYSTTNINHIYYDTSRGMNLCGETVTDGYDPISIPGCTAINTSIGGNEIYFLGGGGAGVFDNFDEDIWTFRSGQHPELTIFYVEPNVIPGSGTEESPYEINTCNELLAIADDLTAYYIMTSNITCGVIDPITNEEEEAFSGSLDGDGFMLSFDLVSTTGFVGFFEQINGASLENIQLEVDVSGNGNDIGALSPLIINSTITNISGIVAVELGDNVDTTIANVGGLGGSIEDSFITDSDVEVDFDIAADSDDYAGISNIGGIAGYTTNTEYSDNTVSGNMDIDAASITTSGINSIGGLIGFEFHHSKFYNNTSSIAEINIEGLDNTYIYDVGGIVGILCSGFIGRGGYCEFQGNTASGDINVTSTSSNNIGGLLGTFSFVSEFGGLAQIINNTSNINLNIHSDTIVQFIGGMYGAVNDSNIQYNQFNGSISINPLNDTLGAYYVGGITGFSNGNHIQDSFVNADLEIFPTDTDSAQGYAGGITGWADQGVIERVYSAGSLTYGDVSNVAEHRGIGGVIGAKNFLVTLKDSFTTMDITILGNSMEVGSLVGAEYNVDELVASNNYVDYEMVGEFDCLGFRETTTQECSEVNIGDTNPNYFKNNIENGPFMDWDFATIWEIVEDDYPIFTDTDDADGDSILNIVEMSGATLDGNNDGIYDYLQANVATIFNPVSEMYSVFETTCDSIISVQIDPEAVATTQDVAFEYSVGLMSFILDCDVAETATIAQYYYGDYDASLFTARKYNSEEDSFSTITGANLTNTVIHGQNVMRVVYQVTDGGELDEDGEENGIIVDPSGPGINSVGVPNTGFGGLSYIKR